MSQEHIDSIVDQCFAIGANIESLVELVEAVQEETAYPDLG